VGISPLPLIFILREKGDINMSTMYRVKNRGASLVVYKIPEDGIRREFKPGQTLQISSEELEKLTYQPGGSVILSQFLQILDLEAIQQANIKVEPEYHMSETDVANLIKSGSLDAFLDALDFAPVGVIDLIKKLSIDIPMVDIHKRRALKEKTGFDVEAALKHNEEDKEDDQKTILKQTGERRVQTEAVPAGRRTAPKYNVVNKTTETANAESVE
jgi:hypothetical protein